MEVYICILAFIMSGIFGLSLFDATLGHRYLNGFNQWLYVIMMILMVINVVELRTQSPFTASIFTGFLTVLMIVNHGSMVARVQAKQARDSSHIKAIKIVQAKNDEKQDDDK